MAGVYRHNKKDDWETPQYLFMELNEEFDFTVDACATKDNTKCRVFIDDALNVMWRGRVFCNPPYGRQIKKFAEKAWLSFQSKHTDLIVMLLPARTDTLWFHDFILDKAEIRFLKGRLKFEINGVDTKNSAPFPSMVVIYKR